MKLTVFTPTYNRAYCLERLYRSLQGQSCRDFEWLVVDDGSQDDTRELVARWQGEGNDFPIRYYYQENGGKHRAINCGLDLAAGELFFTVDSDDYLTADALEKVVSWEASIASLSGYCGVAGNLGTSPTETPNTPFDGPYWDGSLLSRYDGGKVTIDGERALVFYTDIHRKYKYPEFENEKFMTEAVAWNRMARDGYRMRFYNDIIWIYEYLPDGLTWAGFRLFRDNPQGYCLFLQEKTAFLTPGFPAKWKCGYALYCDLIGTYTPKEIGSFPGFSQAQVCCFRLARTILGLWKGR